MGPPANRLEFWPRLKIITLIVTASGVVSYLPPDPPAGLFSRASPSSKRPPYGDGWLHEMKHEGFRCIARKDGKRVRLYSRPGNDLTRRFIRIVDAVVRLNARTCISDGEAVACGPDGIASFDLIRYR